MVELLNALDFQVSKVEKIAYLQSEYRDLVSKFGVEIDEYEKSTAELRKELECYVRASTLVGNVSDENVRNLLDKVTGTINRTLALLFAHDKREIRIESSMYNNTYPHFNVVLVADGNRTTTFLQSGSGLAEIVSFLFDVCLIHITKGRKILVMDEILNGVHDDAKAIIKDLMTALAEDFQFFLVEYRFDLGAQFEFVKSSGETKVIPYVPSTYYYDLAVKHKIGAVPADVAESNTVSDEGEAQ